MRSIRVPQDRVGAIIGPKGNTKRMIQKISGIKIDIDTEEGEVLGIVLQKPQMKV